jgi:hypothetical protein
MHGDGIDVARLALAVDPHPAADGGLPAAVVRGHVSVPQLGDEPWQVDPDGSHALLLHRSADGSGRMTYDLALRAPDGAGSARLVGVKHLTGTGAGLLPARIWRETTTLHVQVLVDDEVVARGVALLHPADFARQMISMRARPLTALRFAVAFARGIAAVYLRRG